MLKDSNKGALNYRNFSSYISSDLYFGIWDIFFGYNVLARSLYYFLKCSDYINDDYSNVNGSDVSPSCSCL